VAPAVAFHAVPRLRQSPFWLGLLKDVEKIKINTFFVISEWGNRHTSFENEVRIEFDP
jgi:hypothetical protein